MFGGTNCFDSTFVLNYTIENAFELNKNLVHINRFVIAVLLFVIGVDCWVL